MGQPTLEDFLDVAKDLKMNIVTDNGLTRHIKYAKPESCLGWFDLVTWKGCLCIHGDYGSFAFSRTEDMFRFFRSGLREDGIKINPGYWSEKCVAASTHDGVKVYSPKVLREKVLYEFNNWWEYEKGRAEARKEEYLQQIEDNLLSEEGGIRGEIEAYDRALSFEFKGFSLPDFWEYDLKEYTYRYIWSLYAIVWGIQQYDECKEEYNGRQGDSANSA